MISSNSAGVSSAKSANCLANLIFSLNTPRSSPNVSRTKWPGFLLSPFGPIKHQLNPKDTYARNVALRECPPPQARSITLSGDIWHFPGGYVEKCTTLLEWVRRYRGNEPAGY